MENLRNSEGNSGLGGSSDPDYIAYEDDDAAVEVPPAIGQDERRMHVRAYNFWAGLLGDRQFPCVEDLNPETDEDFGSNSVLLDFTEGVENPTIQFLGDALRDECEIGEEIKTIEEIPARSLLSRITDHYLQIIANQAPIGFEAEFVNQRGITIMYRGILLPFSTDDDNIDFIYGVINWKEVAASEVSAKLEDEVAEAILKAPIKKETGPVWADGPTSDSLADMVKPPKVDALQAISEPDFEQPGDDATLSDWLSAARSSADHAAHCEQRSRKALYQAIGQAYDFYLMTKAHPEEYEALLEDSEMVAQDRAPMTPVVKLVFGGNYDKTRLTEYAAALRYAEQNAVEQSAFAAFLENHPGGLKAVVYAERDTRKSDSASIGGVTRSDELLERLRAAPLRKLDDIEAGDAEFVVLVARRDDSGKLAVVGSVSADEKLTNRVLRQTKI